MNIEFYKYHGTGNDFILIDNRNNHYNKFSSRFIKKICHRRFGIGGDGFIILGHHPEFDFRMKYYNSDGYESSMCGNGGRCIMAFAKKLGIMKTYARFESIDGIHEAFIDRNDNVQLKMNDVKSIENNADHFYLDTGSPHYVKFLNQGENITDMDIFHEGKKIRYNERFKTKGTNVNFAKYEDNKLYVRTYERGVEDETYSCGTGVVASAICTALKFDKNKKSFPITTYGGNLRVFFESLDDTGVHDVWLEGPATFVFEGKSYFQ